MIRLLPVLLLQTLCCISPALAQPASTGTYPASTMPASSWVGESLVRPLRLPPVRPNPLPGPYAAAGQPPLPPPPVEAPSTPAPVPLPADAPEVVSEPNPQFDQVAEEAIAAPSVAWYRPRRWLGPVWNGDFELGINGSSGNAESLSLRAGGSLERKTDHNELLMDITHGRTSNGSIITQNNALGKFRYDHLFGASPWSLFAINTLEYDQFKAFDLRLVFNMGAGYKLIDTKSTKLKGRFGSGVSHEIGGPDDSWVPEADFGADYKWCISPRQKLYATLDYYPEWGDFANYRFVTDAGWEVLLDASTNLNLKIGVIDRYDSTPNGRKPNDLDYSLLLLWKL